MSSDCVRCQMTWIFLLLEALNSKTSEVHMGKGLVTHIREIQQGATGTYDPVILLEDSVNYTSLIVMNPKKHDYSSLPTAYFPAHCTSS